MFQITVLLRVIEILYDVSSDSIVTFKSFQKKINSKK